MHRAIICLLALLVVASGARHISAQNIKAAVSGRVIDQTGAAITGATVNVADEQRGLVRTAASGAQGEFYLPGLEPGVYLVKVNQPGFAGYQSQPLAISVGDNAKLEVRGRGSQMMMTSI